MVSVVFKTTRLQMLPLRMFSSYLPIFPLLPFWGHDKTVFLPYRGLTTVLVDHTLCIHSEMALVCHLVADLYTAPSQSFSSWPTLAHFSPV